jgi:hypothetical protein
MARWEAAWHQGLPPTGHRSPCSWVGRVDGGATSHRCGSAKEQGRAAVPAGQAACQQGHPWWWEPDVAAIGGGGARTWALPAQTSKLLTARNVRLPAMERVTARRRRRRQAHLPHGPASVSSMLVDVTNKWAVLVRWDPTAIARTNLNKEREIRIVCFLTGLFLLYTPCPISIWACDCIPTRVENLLTVRG